MYGVEQIKPRRLLRLGDFKGVFMDYYICEFKRDVKEITMLLKVLENDLENPYKSKYIEHYLKGRKVINGVEYEIYYCRVLYTSRNRVREDENLFYDFYLLYDLRDIVKGTLEEYLNAEKLYVV